MIAADVRDVGHALDEQERGEDHADLDGDREVDDDGEEEGRQQHRDVALGRLEERRERAPLAHVVRDDRQHRGERRQRNEARPLAEKDQHEQHDDGMDHAGDGRAAAVLDVRRRAGDGAGRRDAAEEAGRDVGDALGDELHVGLVAAADHAVGHDGREQRLDRREQRDRDGRRKELAHAVERDGRQARGGDRGVDLAEARTDRLDRKPERRDRRRRREDRDDRRGHLRETFGQRARIRNEPAATPIAGSDAEPRCAAYASHFARKCAGTAPIRRPSRSLTCDEKMMTAIPLVKPVTTGYGMNLIAPPKRARPNTISMTPAMIVTIVRPSRPYRVTMP